MSRKTPEIDTNSADEIALGDAVFSIRDKELRSASGEIIALRSQSAEVLAVLAKHAGEIVSKSTLMESVWTDTFVTDDSLVQCIADIRRALGDDGQNIVQTFPKKGYRLIARPAAQAAPAGVARRSLVLSVLAVVVVAAVAGVYLLWLSGNPGGIASGNDIPTIAVLPFDDFSTGEDKGYLSDAIAEGIITELARSKTYAVIARNSSFTYRGKAVDVRQIGKELDANYVLEGSQQKSGDALKVTAQLIDAETGRHLWSNVYDRKIGDFFVLQEEIIRTLADRVGTRIERPLPISNTARVTALHYHLQGIEQIRKNFSAEGADVLRQLNLKAIEADPESQFGYIGLAWAYRQDAVFGWNGFDRDEALALAEKNADKAIALAPDDSEAHNIRAWLHVERGEINEAISRYERAIALNPSASNVIAASSSPLLYVGRTDEAIVRIKQAMGIDPFFPDWFHWQMGWALWEKHDCGGSVAAMHRMSKIEIPAQRMLAASYSCLGDKQKAHEALSIFLNTSSQATLRGERERMQKLWTAPGSLDRWVEDLRLAGMPE